MRHGIALTWPNQLAFSVDGMRHDVVPGEGEGGASAAPATAVGDASDIATVGGPPPQRLSPHR